ncbi:MAG: DUF4270 domain-containing protein [Aureispira sp.]|nr:DUF4270 domain-containing protein [Aureispira sp.]
MKYWSKLLLWSMGVGCLTLAGCSKSTEIGLSLVEQERSDIILTDTLPLGLTTIQTPPSEMQAFSSLVCGAYTDPIFGKTTAGTYLNFRLTSTNVSFPDATFDSLVLSLAYEVRGHYGDILTTPTAQTWDVYRVTEPIVEGQTYYSNTTLTTGTALASGVSFTPNYKDSVSVQGTLLAPHVRIRLDDALGKELLDPTDNSIYNSNSDFKQFFNGIYIKPTAGATNSSIIRFRGRDLQTKVTLYYSEPDGNGGTVQRTFEYLRDEDAEQVAVFDHDYTGTTILDNNSTDSVVYVQGLDGTSLKVEFPDISNLGNVIVNKAELFIYAVDTGNLEFPIPIQLTAKQKNADGTLSKTKDVLNSESRGNILLFGGIITLTETNDWGFPIRIEEFLQELIDGDLYENAMYLLPILAIEPERVILTNQQRSTLKAKLSLTYTKID